MHDKVEIEGEEKGETSEKIDSPEHGRSSADVETKSAAQEEVQPVAQHSGINSTPTANNDSLPFKIKGKNSIFIERKRECKQIVWILKFVSVFPLQ